MKAFKKIASIVILALLFSVKGYSQEAQSKTSIYKITPEEAQKLTGKSEQSLGMKNGTNVYSCEVNSLTKKVIVSRKKDDGSITKETYDIKEEKKTTIPK